MNGAAYNGSCLCGSIAYEFDGEPGPFGLCHCKSCQKASGSAFAANFPVERSTFRFTAGEERLRRFESSPGKFRCFCPDCGSPILAYFGENPSTYRVRLGSLDSVIDARPRCHFFTSEQASWLGIADSLLQFESWPDREVLELRGSRQRGD